MVEVLTISISPSSASLMPDPHLSLRTLNGSQEVWVTVWNHCSQAVLGYRGYWC